MTICNLVPGRQWRVFSKSKRGKRYYITSGLVGPVASDEGNVLHLPTLNLWEFPEDIGNVGVLETPIQYGGLSNPEIYRLGCYSFTYSSLTVQPPVH